MSKKPKIMNKIKLTVDSCEFEFNENRVTCTINTSFNLDYFLIAAYKDTKVKNIINSCFNVNKKKNKLEITTVGYAKCLKTDTYDIKIGKRIAYAKALKSSFKLYRNLLEECYCAYKRKELIINDNIQRMIYLIYDKENNLTKLRK